ncbi:hypothetical protein FNAPI_11154 [Fusarium napiforme]|uniref:Uncharacterized protein n=1 Tax=Fusarium napiforme TaxID=42672 RepID=A0A8H5IK52_9HYPO|nr:hypothetical protein FNAPI_11154 [Fusarium napiforme]
MDATELTDDRFAEIKDAVGNPFDNGDPYGMSPDEYMAKLQTETGSDDVLDQYLQKASRLDSEPERASAEEWLKQLTAVDFEDIGAISSHRFTLTIDEVGRFNLGNNGEDAFAVATYPGAILPEDLDPDRKYSGDYYPHTAFISLHMGKVSHSQLGPKSSKAATLAPSGQAPFLVLPIGQLQKKPKGLEDDDFESTDYVLVIDAVTTSHPVWLIYDRNAEDDLGESHPVHPDKRPLVFKELEKNFYAMQMLKDMRATGVAGPIMPKEIAISEAEKLFLK